MKIQTQILLIVRLIVMSVAMGFAFNAPATASIEDQVTFSVEGMVIVWGETHEASQISPAANFTSNDDLISQVSYDAPAVTTGLLVPVKTSAPAYLGYPDNSASNAQVSEHSFYVASNTAFQISSDVSAVADQLLDNVAVAISVDQAANNGMFGSAAQLPHVSGGNGGVNKNIRSLRDMQADPVIYTGTRRTAARSGSIVDQSVRFGITYEQMSETNTAQAFSSRDVTYTIYIP